MKKFALDTPQYKRMSHAHCRSFTRWIFSTSAWQLALDSTSCSTNSFLPTGTPKIFSLEEQNAQKQDRFLRGRQIAYLIYNDHFQVSGSHDSVENCADLFTISLQNDDIQEFDSKWDGILLSMTKIPQDDILEGLYKLRIRESEKT